jgi:hypothetical protein
MEDCFICNHLTYKRDCCTFYRIWNSNISEKCNTCINKKCDKCSNKDSSILKDGELISCCNVCIYIKNNRV